MSSVLIDETNLTATANAIRSKLGTQSTYTPSGFATAINSIPSGGGGTTYSIIYGDVENAPAIFYSNDGTLSQWGSSYSGDSIDYPSGAVVAMEVFNNILITNDTTGDEVEATPIVDDIWMFVMPESDVIIDGWD